MATDSNTPTISKRKRNVLTLTQKIEVCERLEKGEKRHMLCKIYNVGISTISDIYSRKSQYLKFIQNIDPGNTSLMRRTLRRPKLEELDLALYDWYLMKRSEGVSITGHMMIDAAKDFYRQMGLTESCTFSEGWLARFKVRHGIKYSHTPEKQHPLECINIETLDQLNKFINLNSLTPDQMFYTCEYRLYWKELPYNIQNEGEDEFFDVLMCISATGTRKINLLINGSYDGGDELCDITNTPYLYKTRREFIDREKNMFEWFHRHFVPAVRYNFRQSGMSEDAKAVLLIKGNKSQFQSQLASKNVFTLFVNETGLFEPLNELIVRDIKYQYRKFLFKHLSESNNSINDFFSNYSFRKACSELSHIWLSSDNVALLDVWNSILNNRKLTPLDIPKVSTHEELMDSIKKISFDNFSKQYNLDEIIEWIKGDDSNSRNDVNPAEKVEIPLNDHYYKEEDLNQTSADFEDKYKRLWDHASTAFKVLIKFANTQKCFSKEEMLQLNLLFMSFEDKKQLI